MVWLILLVLIIAAFAVPRFGKALLVFVGAVIAIVAVIDYVSNRRADAERAAAATRIHVDELHFVDLVLQPQYGTGSYKLVGQIRNLSSQYTLTNLRVKVRMQDCIIPMSSADARLDTALRNARTAGDTTAVRVLAGEINRLRRDPLSRIRTDAMNDADLYELMRDRGLPHEQAVDSVEGRRKGMPARSPVGNDARQCLVVGESDEHIRLNVPPGQARALDEDIYFSALRAPHGRFQWDYRLLEVTASE